MKFSKDFKPGINHEMIDLALQSKPQGAAFCLKFGGRKISSGFQDDTGDIDLIGCNSDPTLSEKQQKRASRVNFLTHLINEISLNSIPLTSCDTIHPVVLSLKSVVQIMSQENIHMRDLRLRKGKGMEVLHKKAGEDWQKSKYKLAIMSIQGTIIQINDLLCKGSDLCNSLCKAICFIQGSSSLWSDCGRVNITKLDNFRSLPTMSNADVAAMDVNEIPLYLRQRSEDWFLLRKQFAITGSTLFDIAGFDMLKLKKQHYDPYHRGISLPTPSEEVQKAMDHGTAFEDNAVATLCTKILPVYFPSTSYAEIGSVVLKQYKTSHFHTETGECKTDVADHYSFALVFPDGVLVDKNKPQWSGQSDFIYSVELKSLYFRKQPHSTVPLRYIPQLELECAIPSRNQTIYVSSRPDISTAFLYPGHDSFLDELMNEVKESFVNASRFSKHTESSRSSKKKLGELSEDSVFLGEFKTVIGHRKELPPDIVSEQRTTDNSKTNLISLLTLIKQFLNDSYNVQRERATEAITFMLSDTDRMFSISQVNSSPFCYVLSGYSLPVPTMKKVVHKVFNACHDKGTNIVAVSFDGQWHKLKSRGLNLDAPLTLFQIQVDIWNEVIKHSKKGILNLLCQLSNKSNVHIVTVGSVSYVTGFKMVNSVPGLIPSKKRKKGAVKADESRLPT